MSSRCVRVTVGLILLIGLARTGFSYDSKLYAVDVQVEARSAPPELLLSWPAIEYARQYHVRRKDPEGTSWGSTTTLPGSATGFSDTTVQPGIAYEYEIRMETTQPAQDGGFVSAFSYVLAGIAVRERDQRGKAILIVDHSVAPSLSTELETFRRDLIGDGWTVVQREVSRTDPVATVKNVILSEYHADPGNTRAVILIGHVPVPYSGAIAPDMHESHRGAWPADLFYGEMDGDWTDHSVQIRGEDFAENDNYPGDGKFDQSIIPSTVELEVGRIDFANLPSFAPRNEIDLLRSYFRKNHAFRHRQFTLQRLGLVRDNFGDVGGDAPAVDAWRHFGLFFGRERTREVGHDSFFTALNEDGYLWAYGAGGGANDKADGVGTTRDFAANDPKAAFLILHGSYFGDWNHQDNFLRAAIATPGYTLASIWAGLPHWYLHHLALGETLGYSTRATQNNIATYRSQRNFSAGEVHVALLGDPTLRIFPVVPPGNLLARPAGAAVELEWSASGNENIPGYHIYHALAEEGPYTRITQEPVAATAYAHATGAGRHHYMVRAVKLETSGAGTFRNLSQGIFASVEKAGGALPIVTVEVADGDAGEFRANAGSFRITRDAPDTHPLTVYYTLSGAAENGVDYLPAAQSIQIPGGSSSALLAIYPVDDRKFDPDELIQIGLRADSAYQIGSPSSASFTIRDSTPNEPPSAHDQSVGAIVGVPELITLTGSDPEGRPLEFTLETPPSRGTIAGSPPNLAYTATESSGTDTFTFVVSDGESVSPPGIVSVSLYPRPVIQQIQQESGGISIEFRAPPGRPFLVETSPDAQEWEVAGSASAGEASIGRFHDNQVNGARIKLYRLELDR